MSYAPGSKYAVDLFPVNPFYTQYVLSYAQVEAKLKGMKLSTLLLFIPPAIEKHLRLPNFDLNLSVYEDNYMDASGKVRYVGCIASALVAELANTDCVTIQTTYPELSYSGTRLAGKLYSGFNSLRLGSLASAEYFLESFGIIFPPDCEQYVGRFEFCKYKLDYIQFGLDGLYPFIAELQSLGF